ncbi:MAG: hypothetical protein HZB55_18610 [Deltaproteobacteria bacterium]|nr:hypothetical protein [Deltaproteobacteria bacterium]
MKAAGVSKVLGLGCPVCRAWRLRDAEERDDDRHAPGCALRGVTDCRAGR